MLYMAVLMKQYFFIDAPFHSPLSKSGMTNSNSSFIPNSALKTSKYPNTVSHPPLASPFHTSYG